MVLHTHTHTQKSNCAIGLCGYDAVSCFCFGRVLFKRKKIRGLKQSLMFCATVLSEKGGGEAVIREPKG